MGISSRVMWEVDKLRLAGSLDLHVDRRALGAAERAYRLSPPLEAS